MTIIDSTTTYDKVSFNNALSSRELLPARYRLEVKTAEIFDAQRNRKEEVTTYSLHKTNVIVIALKKLWCSIFGGNFDRNAYNIERIADIVSEFFVKNPPENKAAVNKNLSTLETNLRKAGKKALQKNDEETNENLIRVANKIRGQIK